MYKEFLQDLDLKHDDRTVFFWMNKPLLGNI